MKDEHEGAPSLRLSDEFRDEGSRLLFWPPPLSGSSTVSSIGHVGGVGSSEHEHHGSDAHCTINSSQSQANTTLYHSHAVQIQS